MPLVAIDPRTTWTEPDTDLDDPQFLPVTLTGYEAALGDFVGQARYDESKRLGLKDAHGFQGDGLEISLRGARGEVAVAKALDIYYDGSVNTFKSGGDVGCLQVRCAGSSSGSLIIRPSDSCQSFFVSVVQRSPHNYVVTGWIRASKAKGNDAWFTDNGNGRPPAWFVPFSDLRCPLELRTAYHEALTETNSKDAINELLSQHLA